MMFDDTEDISRDLGLCFYTPYAMNFRFKMLFFGKMHLF